MVCKIGFTNWNAKIALLRVHGRYLPYQTFPIGADKHNGILLSLLLLVAETIMAKQKQHSCPSVYLSACLSVRSSPNFLKIGSLVFYNIVHGDSWAWYLLTGEATFLKKKKWRPEFGRNEPKSGPKSGFSSFSWIWTIDFPWNCIRR